MSNLSQNELLGTSYTVHVGYTFQPIEEFLMELNEVAMHDGRAWERHRSCKDIDTTDGERKMFLAKVPNEFLGKSINSIWDALSEYYDKLGYRFAIELEATAFAKAHPDLLSENCILALGSSTLDYEDDRCITLLCGNDLGNFLKGIEVENELHVGDLLLLIPNPQVAIATS